MKNCQENFGYWIIDIRYYKNSLILVVLFNVLFNVYFMHKPVLLC